MSGGVGRSLLGPLERPTSLRQTLSSGAPCLLVHLPRSVCPRLAAPRFAVVHLFLVPGESGLLNHGAIFASGCNTSWVNTSESDFAAGQPRQQGPEGRRYGITVPFDGVPLSDHRDLIEQLPDLGYTDAWTGESSAADGFSPLAAAAIWAPSLNLGTAVVPVYTRGPGLLAMQAATLADLAPGRFSLGIGTSSDVIVERWNAASFDEPFKRVRDTVRFLRSAFAGEKVNAVYDTFEIHGFRLDRRPAIAPRILVAALRSGMLELAGREADGAIINWLSPEDVKTVAPLVGPGKEVVARIFVCPSSDTDHVRAVGRMMVAAYLNVKVYAEAHRWLGRGEQLEGMWQAWASGDRKAALAAIPDQVVDELIVHGPPERCREIIGRYVENGVTVPVLAVIPVGIDLREAIRALAPMD
jgi:probable F420-dependent oxidoreductase